ncbi:MAG TPA: metal ABC transporter substrate-binding protein [Actinomycetes bacterium]|nr:metal ABC transporter substrate-binding protein [Actinomycetes bacterium]
MRIPTRPRHAALALLALLVGLVPAGCAADGAGPQDGRLGAVATTTQLADFVRQIGGDRVRVTGILPPNVDAHDYEPSPADLAAIGRAPVLVANGVGLESWLDETIRASGFSGRRVDASTGVHLLGHSGEGGGAPAGEGRFDPHIWQDPRNAEVMVANVARALSDADPGGAVTYRANLAAYRARLQRLDAQVERDLAGLSNRKLVTNHEAFGYYAARYRLEYVGAIIPSFDTSAELSARQVADLVARIRRTGVKAIFAESSLPPETAQTIASEAGVEVVTGPQALYGDSLGPPDSPAGTYLDMIRHNTDTIVAHLR